MENEVDHSKQPWKILSQQRKKTQHGQSTVSDLPTTTESERPGRVLNSLSQHMGSHLVGEHLAPMRFWEKNHSLSEQNQVLKSSISKYIPAASGLTTTHPASSLTKAQSLRNPVLQTRCTGARSGKPVKTSEERISALEAINVSTRRSQ